MVVVVIVIGSAHAKRDVLDEVRSERLPPFRHPITYYPHGVLMPGREMYVGRHPITYYSQGVLMPAQRER